MLDSKRKVKNAMKKKLSYFPWRIRMSISSRNWSTVMVSKIFMIRELIIGIKIGKVSCNRLSGSSRLFPGDVRTSKQITRHLFKPLLSTNSKFLMEAGLLRLYQGSGISRGNK